MTPIEVLLADGKRLRREGRHEDALGAYQAAANKARAAGAPEALVDSLCGLGQVERDRGRGDAAIGHYEDALAACRGRAGPLQHAHVARHLGDLYREAARFGAARPLLEEAIGLYRQVREAPRLDMANALRTLALLLESTGSEAEAIPLWRQARALYIAAGVDAGVRECDSRLASSDPA